MPSYAMFTGSGKVHVKLGNVSRLDQEMCMIVKSCNISTPDQVKCLCVCVCLCSSVYVYVSVLSLIHI